jgi:hypothetical protein
MGVRSCPCFADPYSATIAAPPKVGTKVPKHHSKYIPAASAATASGYLETVLSKLTRRSKQNVMPRVLRRVSSDRSLTFIGEVIPNEVLGVDPVMSPLRQLARRQRDRAIAVGAERGRRRRARAAPHTRTSTRSRSSAAAPRPPGRGRVPRHEFSPQAARGSSGRLCADEESALEAALGLRTRRFRSTVIS